MGSLVKHVLDLITIDVALMLSVVFPTLAFGLSNNGGCCARAQIP